LVFLLEKVLSLLQGSVSRYSQIKRFFNTLKSSFEKRLKKQRMKRLNGRKKKQNMLSFLQTLTMLQLVVM